jgi:hypothetical protein
MILEYSIELKNEIEKRHGGLGLNAYNTIPFFLGLSKTEQDEILETVNGGSQKQDSGLRTSGRQIAAEEGTGDLEDSEAEE